MIDLTSDATVFYNLEAVDNLPQAYCKSVVGRLNLAAVFGDLDTELSKLVSEPQIIQLTKVDGTSDLQACLHKIATRAQQ